MPAESPPPAAPRHASTVLIARDSAEGPQIVLTQRHVSLRFMGGVHVFPGGAVQNSDRDPALLQQLHAPPHSWPDALEPDLQLGHAIAAVRETLEEAGLLLGAPADLSDATLQALRASALADADFRELLATSDVKLDVQDLTPFMRWITPQSEPIRFDTRFYVARAPRAQQASHDARESTALVWLTASAALAAAQRGALKLSPPTARTLAEITDLSSVDALLAHARAAGAPTIEPVLRIVDGQRMVVYPGDPEHPVRERALKGPTRSVFRL
jgi:8-oxo-dGTP pyrophosphatase MutT (NUDIX family)